MKQWLQVLKDGEPYLTIPYGYQRRDHGDTITFEPISGKGESFDITKSKSITIKHYEVR